MLNKNSLGAALCWYQKKIGSYDQQAWEKSIEERVLRGLSHAVPKKVARFKTELIDLDLIRGSYFAKAKPQQSWLITTYLGIIKVIFFPFYLKWWTDQTNSWICFALLVLHTLQSISMCIYFNSDKVKEFEEIPVSEVISPLLLFLILGTLQSQIGASNLVKTSHNSLNYRSCFASSFDSFDISKSNKSNKSSLKAVNLSQKLNKPKFKMNNDLLLDDKPSDDESGLDYTSFHDSKLNYCKKRRKSLKIRKRKSNLEESDISSNSSRTEALLKVKRTERMANSETEGDRDICDISSGDEGSPCSTIGLKSQFKWKFKSDTFLKTSKNSFLDEPKSLVKLKKDKVKSEMLKGRILKFNLSSKVDNSNCDSSAESEGSISQTLPNNKLASDFDWPSINSDGTSDEEDGVDNDDDEPSISKLEDEDFFSHCTEDINLLLNGDENEEFGLNRTGKTSNDKVSCAIWQQCEYQKVDLSVLDISSAVIRKVESVKHSNEYFFLGLLFSIVLAFIPVIFRVSQYRLSSSLGLRGNYRSQLNSFGINNSKEFSHIINEIPAMATEIIVDKIVYPLSAWNVKFVVLIAIIERFFLSFLFFFTLCVAERTFRERFLYAKYFCHLTSSRRARRSELPHFRLNKVRNIKTWLSVRSYLQKHGPQRAIDVIVSSAFIFEVSILTFLCIHLLRESEVCSEKLYCWEMVFWNIAIGLYIMRLIILGSKMNRKSKGTLAILLSEQINLYLQLEQKPHKKEELTLANHVIKSAADLLKHLESPFKISGFSANPYLYNITKVIVLSAFSAVLTEFLGFKLKLYKIKITN